jgi:adenine-specific DNA-methyltransferase
MRPALSEERPSEVLDLVIDRPVRRRDSRQAYYTSSRDITRYMASRLNAALDSTVWEPCSGSGDLVDAVLEYVPSVSILASEIDNGAVEELTRKYKQAPNVEVMQLDALEASSIALFQQIGPFSHIISNPPYGAYMTMERRSLLKKRFPDMYVKETYGLILYHCLSLLKQSGKLVFILPDTFLWLHRHEFLRKYILTKFSVDEIALFPSKFFPGVNFGYSGLCIISISNLLSTVDHRIKVIDKLASTEALSALADGNAPSAGCSIAYINQSEVCSRKHYEFIRPDDSGVTTLKQRCSLTLGDLADVKTGFYSGNDQKWIRRRDASVPRSSKYADVDKALVFKGEEIGLDGIDGEKTYIPIVRGGAASFYRPTNWYVNWSTDSVAEYRRPGKNPARFQNSQYYFREGIGVPMIASGKLTGALLSNRVFDQGIVGVFPFDLGHTLFLLGFLNSSMATRLLRQINPTANNSANYLKRLPVVDPTDKEISTTTVLVNLALEEVRDDGKVSAKTSNELDLLYEAIWSGT